MREGSALSCAPSMQGSPRAPSVVRRALALTALVGTAVGGLEAASAPVIVRMAGRGGTAALSAALARAASLRARGRADRGPARGHRPHLARDAWNPGAVRHRPRRHGGGGGRPRPRRRVPGRGQSGSAEDAGHLRLDLPEPRSRVRVREDVAQGHARGPRLLPGQEPRDRAAVPQGGLGSGRDRPADPHRVLGRPRARAQGRPPQGGRSAPRRRPPAVRRAQPGVHPRGVAGRRQAHRGLPGGPRRASA